VTIPQDRECAGEAALLAVRSQFDCEVLWPVSHSPERTTRHVRLGEKEPEVRSQVVIATLPRVDVVAAVSER
jgi:hypothetical protein